MEQLAKQRWWLVLAVVLAIGLPLAVVIGQQGQNTTAPAQNNPPPATTTATSGTTTTTTGDWQSSETAKEDITRLERHPIAGNFKPDATTIEQCGNRAVCLEQAYGNLTYTEGPKVALARFDAAIASPGATEQNCHRISHTMGSAALARFSGNVAKAFAAGSASCWSGYYHGILERALLGIASFDPTEFAEKLKPICDDPEIRATTFLAYQCIHGIGHGVMITTELDLEFALKVCNLLNGEWDQQSCKGGVFMENISTSYGVKSQWLRDNDLVYPCNVVAENDKLYCYLMVTSRILNANGYNWSKTAQICGSAEKNWVSTCFQSYGRDASGSSRQTVGRVIEHCQVAKAFGGERDCILGAAKDFTSNYASGIQAGTLCDAVATSEQRPCFHAVGQILAGFSNDPKVQEQNCAISNNPAGPEACLRGSRGQGIE
jgi:hypothetical protein